VANKKRVQFRENKLFTDDVQDIADSFNKLVFSDEFDEFDLSVWSHEITLGGGGNWEFEYYTNNRTNSYVRDSVLYILPTLTMETIGLENLENGYTMDLWGSTPADMCTGNNWYGCERTAGGGGNIINPIQSASVRTVNSFSFKYGKIEIRAKLPKGDWLWPALWLLPTYNSYGEWPASGEIDIVESRGNDASYPDGGINQMGSTLHWGPNWLEDPYMLTHEVYTLPEGQDFSQDFHTFGLLWTNTSMITYVDDPSNVVLNVPIKQAFWTLGDFQNTGFNNPWLGRPNNAPFDQKFYFIFNVAVGGTGGYFPDGVGGKPWSNEDPNAVNAFWNARDDWYATWIGETAAMQIDWVHVYQ
jgi:beta-glucanase (GH16 family)